MSDAVRTVLIVDDDPQILRLVEKMLKPRQVKLLGVLGGLRLVLQVSLHAPHIEGADLIDGALPPAPGGRRSRYRCVPAAAQQRHRKAPQRLRGGNGEPLAVAHRFQLGAIEHIAPRSS